MTSKHPWPPFSFVKTSIFEKGTGCEIFLKNEVRLLPRIHNWEAKTHGRIRMAQHICLRLEIILPENVSVAGAFLRNSRFVEVFEKTPMVVS